MSAPRKPRNRRRPGLAASAAASTGEAKAPPPLAPQPRASVWRNDEFQSDELPPRARTVEAEEVVAQKRRQPHLPVDVAALSAVDTPAVGVSVRIPAGSEAASTIASPMEKEHFGSCLRRAREKRDISLSDVSQKTKVSRSVLELLERGELDALPAGVYSRGFIRSFARAVGTDESEPLSLYERAMEARDAAEKAKFTTPVPDAPELMAHQTDDETSAPRRGLGLAVFVIILLLIATITLSLLLRRPPPSGEGLSLGSPAVPAGAVPPAPGRPGPRPSANG